MAFQTIKNGISKCLSFIHGTVRTIARLYHPTTMKEKGIDWTIGLLLVTLAIFLTVIGLYWNTEPKRFNVRHVVYLNGDAGKTQAKTPIPGYFYTATIIRIGDTLLHKRGGYIFNDKLLPGIWMDNIPSWESGALDMLRDATRALRNHFARAQTQSVENKNLAEAEPHFNFRKDGWILPPTEGEYQKGVDGLKLYLADLTKPKAEQLGAQFFARGDNLRQYLEFVEQRLGSLSYRLGRSAVHRHSAVSDEETRDKFDAEITPWLEVDNVFYETRGATWALLHIFQAIEEDFKEILETKKAMATINQIIHELADAQEAVLSPMVLNGDGYGLFANYSLTLANHVSRANAAVQDLRELLTGG
jgi:hypothetical protein